MAVIPFRYYSGNNLQGVSGSLLTLLRTVLVTGEGWTEDYTGTNQAIFRQATGSGYSLFVSDNGALAAGAREALVRGCESATAITTLVDPFPLVSQLADANCVWRKSDTADTTNRQWYAVVTDSGFFGLFVFYGSFASDYYWFGNAHPVFTGDNYACGISVRRTGNTSTTSVALDARDTSLFGSNLGGIFWARTEDGLFKSPAGSHWRASASTIFGSTNNPALCGQYPHPRTNDLAVLQAFATSNGGSAQNTVNGSASLRAALPCLFYPLIGQAALVTGIANVDTATSTPYDASSNFLFLMQNNSNTNSGVVLLQTAGDWKFPEWPP
jgi:hypothetical protein